MPAVPIGTSMDEAEARKILRRHIDGYRSRSYRDLVKLIGEVNAFQTLGESGTEYAVEIEVMWDGARGGDVRVIGSIDDQTLLRSISPLSEDFILGADGTFVDE